ncbi:MAG: MGMT family protein [Endomicrobia bacterium]|nr:MGMT family protein [Endomicrobiia bacterium]
MRNNPFAPIIPCHRVIASTGKMHGYSAKGGIKLKEQMLKFEIKTKRDANKLYTKPSLIDNRG